MDILHTAEIQGPYGPLTIPEQVVQQIWHEGKYLRDQLLTVCGRRLEVEYPGVWHHREGPDFRNARLRFDGDPVVGDVEVHFRAKDWRLHGHDQDPEFNRVVLHVVLFPGEAEASTQRGTTPETVVLLPHLEMDMEQYLLDFRLARMEESGEMPLAELMEPLCGEALLTRLAEAAKLRWVAKRDVLANRLQATGWESICHQALLEALGGRRNRAVFAKIALDHTIEQMREQTSSAEMLFNSRKGEWKLAGLRPANQPKARLGQYLDLLNEKPDWPGALRSLELPLPPESFDPIQTARFRKDCLRQVSGRLGQTILPGMSSGIANTLIADVFLPLLAADADADLFPHWYHWQPGNFPEALVTFLRQQCAERGIRVPLGNGLQQGILQLLNEAKGWGRVLTEAVNGTTSCPTANS